MKLHGSMEIADRKQQEALELFNSQVEESKKTLNTLDKDLKKKVN